MARATAPDFDTVVIWNAGARRASSPRSRAVRARLDREPGVVVRDSGSRQQARALAAAAARRGARLILAAGGDGTVAAVAAGLVPSRSTSPTRLGVLPLGTANDIARMLGLSSRPADLMEMVERQRGGSSRRLDVVELRHDGRRRLVVNLVALGNGAAVTLGATRGAKQRWGHWSYLRSAVHVLRDLHRWDVIVALDGDAPRALRVLTFVIANGPMSAGGLAIASGADPTDGLLDVVTLQDAPATEIAAVVARLLLSQVMDGEHVLHLTARRIRLGATRPLPLAADGDMLPPARRVEARMLAHALPVVALEP